MSRSFLPLFLSLVVTANVAAALSCEEYAAMHEQAEDFVDTSVPKIESPHE
eukprot:CAMPEP_0115022902 /NCGR_PEP_ID=MMETSP0216-20121206/31929_1 /TAXON_ID=223996 /ORGANISM="Protocruzia adherens, Strain Boccale" /LENGTH=50 /DNA_ID=CAMNT_0002395879 /DNA_START=34 /DNA_END=183 /DNA_ORIENTATION=+